MMHSVERSFISSEILASRHPGRRPRNPDPVEPAFAQKCPERGRSHNVLGFVDGRGAQLDNTPAVTGWSHAKHGHCQLDEVSALLCLEADCRRSFRRRRSPHSRPETPGFSTVRAVAVVPFRLDGDLPNTHTRHKWSLPKCVFGAWCGRASSARAWRSSPLGALHRPLWRRLAAM